jgi:hypothetical protein
MLQVRCYGLSTAQLRASRQRLHTVRKRQVRQPRCRSVGTTVYTDTEDSKAFPFDFDEGLHVSRVDACVPVDTMLLTLQVAAAL